MNLRSHLVTSYEHELYRLRQVLCEMGNLVERQLDLGIKAIIEGDSAAADEANNLDRQVDKLEKDVENNAIRLLALRSPMGADLREIVASLKISDGLERMGDYAASIARKSLKLSHEQSHLPLTGLQTMGRLVKENLHRIIEAMRDQNPNEAMAAWHADAIIDEHYISFFRELVTYMMEDARNIRPCTELLFVAKNLERIGDHATNIAERVFYAVTGENLPNQRPRGRNKTKNVEEDRKDLLL